MTININRSNKRMNDVMTTVSATEAKNMFPTNSVQSESDSLMKSIEAQMIAETQARFVVAQKFPRNEHEKYVKIMEACKRPFLAEQAMYAYPRGGTLVTGASIRLAEVLAQSWGHIEVGVRQVSRGDGYTIAEAYAIDCQNNIKSAKTFYVDHVRDTRKGKIKLSDSRDIYELVANQGARRLRACILAVIPPDIVEAAIEQCKKTLQTGEVPLADQIKKMVMGFDELGIKVSHLEKKLGHKIDATIPTEMVTLRSIFKSLKDGMAKREDFFDILESTEASSKVENILAEKAKK